MGIRLETAQEMLQALRRVAFAKCVWLPDTQQYCIILDRADREMVCNCVINADQILIDWSVEDGEAKAQIDQRVDYYMEGETNEQPTG